MSKCHSGAERAGGVGPAHFLIIWGRVWACLACMFGRGVNFASWRDACYNTAMLNHSNFVRLSEAAELLGVNSRWLLRRAELDTTVSKLVRRSPAPNSAWMVAESWVNDQQLFLDEYMTLTELSEKTGMSAATLTRHIKNGYLPAVRDEAGKRWMVGKNEAKRYDPALKSQNLMSDFRLLSGEK